MPAPCCFPLAPAYEQGCNSAFHQHSRVQTSFFSHLHLGMEREKQVTGEPGLAQGLLLQQQNESSGSSSAAEAWAMQFVTCCDPCERLRVLPCAGGITCSPPLNVVPTEGPGKPLLSTNKEARRPCPPPRGSWEEDTADSSAQEGYLEGFFYIK